ncbi:uncharacterized protein DEA37_0003952 [Paragonimus westermani]|uniref:Uncharacterized protein n=1 Tax=Paragonimus westermani TaxID=34504 RepID=A0A5J4NA24_9TREM|nr:uncharacterized protein DEA37_0003952 [Paragonimus westermani]
MVLDQFLKSLRNRRRMSLADSEIVPHVAFTAALYATSVENRVIQNCLKHKKSPFEALPLDMIHHFPYDFLHSVFLGVVRKLVSLWLESPCNKGVRLEMKTVENVDSRIIACIRLLGDDFPRVCRGWLKFRNWEACEFRQFLLYIGPWVMKGAVPHKNYSNFLDLSMDISVLAHPVFCGPLVEYGNSCLRKFVHEFFHICGAGEMTYNVRSLIHLADDVGHHGQLDSFSAFSFELYIYHIKLMLHCPCNPVAQSYRRWKDECTLAKAMKIDRSLHVEDHSNGCKIRKLSLNGSFISNADYFQGISAPSAAALLRNMMERLMTRTVAAQITYSGQVHGRTEYCEAWLLSAREKRSILQSFTQDSEEINLEKKVIVDLDEADALNLDAH